MCLFSTSFCYTLGRRKMLRVNNHCLNREGTWRSWLHHRDHHCDHWSFTVLILTLMVKSAFFFLLPTTSCFTCRWQYVLSPKYANMSHKLAACSLAMRYKMIVVIRVCLESAFPFCCLCTSAKSMCWLSTGNCLLHAHTYTAIKDPLF